MSENFGNVNFAYYGSFKGDFSFIGVTHLTKSCICSKESRSKPNNTKNNHNCYRTKTATTKSFCDTAAPLRALLKVEVLTNLSHKHPNHLSEEVSFPRSAGGVSCLADTDTPPTPHTVMHKKEV